MRILKENHEAIAAAAAIAAILWAVVQFLVEPYWASLHNEPDDAAIEYLKELHGENLALLRERMRDEIEHEIRQRGASDQPPSAPSDRARSETAEASAKARETISIDPLVENRVQRILSRGADLMNAKSASALLVRVSDGGIVALASTSAEDFGFVTSRATLEHGSVLKPLTAAMALESGRFELETLVDASSPLEWGRFKIRDLSANASELTLLDGMVRSSNVVSARLAMEIGPEIQREYFEKLQLLAPTTAEFARLENRKPLVPRRWGELHAMTISYGHGISLNQFHLATFYATISNGGKLTVPTLFPDPEATRELVFSEETSKDVLTILEESVLRGTGSLANVDEVRIGGATGTADKPKPDGGYFDDKVIATFAAVYPVDRPKYVLIVTLDEPEFADGNQVRRTSGWTAAPIAAQIITELWPI